MPRGDDTGWQVLGDPTEGALVVAALKAGVEATNHEHAILYEIPSREEAKEAVRRCHEAGIRPVMITGWRSPRCAGAAWERKREGHAGHYCPD